MINLLLHLILLQIIIVFIIDLSGIINTFKSLISRFLTNGSITSYDYSLKPIDCSLCMTHHIGVLFLLLTHQFTLISYCMICLLSFLTPVTSSILLYMRDSLLYLINLLYEWQERK